MLIHLIFLITFVLPGHVPFQLIVLVNGEDMFQYQLKHPPMTKSKPEQHQYFVGGGAVSSHVSERHITLVNATSSSISWKLGVLSILPGNVAALVSMRMCVWYL